MENGEERMESGYVLGVNIVGLANGLHLAVKKMRDLNFGLNSR